MKEPVSLARLARRAFTLMELLVCIAVVLLLAGLVFPVVTSGRRAAKRAVAISNLRQTALAILLYNQEYDQQLLPLRDTARSLVDTQVSCDPLDHWRSSCTEDWVPLVGSFGYFIQN